MHINEYFNGQCATLDFSVITNKNIDLFLLGDTVAFAVVVNCN